MNTQDVVVFDVETQRTFDEVGGYENREKLGISYIGVYSYNQDQYFGFTEQELPQLEAILNREKPMLCGFNSINFDVPVMQPYFPNIDLSALPHVDILKDIEAVLGHRLKLDSVAGGTLYEKKSGDGLDAIRWYRAGDMESLAKYCIQDVKVTRDVYEFGKRHGKIYYPTGGNKRAIAVEWSQQKKIQEKIADAFKTHEQIQVEYFDVDDDGVKTNKETMLEVLEYEGGDVFEAFCHASNSKREFHIYDIWQVEATGQNFAHQAKLF
jgi:DEAD/DEAH box helicase domain-containing protein